MVMCCDLVPFMHCVCIAARAQGLLLLLLLLLYASTSLLTQPSSLVASVLKECVSQLFLVCLPGAASTPAETTHFATSVMC
jgi:hypothetical protein